MEAISLTWTDLGNVVEHHNMHRIRIDGKHEDGREFSAIYNVSSEMIEDSVIMTHLMQDVAGRVWEELQPDDARD